MGGRRRLFAVLVVLAAVWPSPATAGQPIQLGPGQEAAVDVDEAGTAYIAWRGNEPSNATLQFCRLPPEATTCDVRSALPVLGEGITRPSVAVDGAVVRVLQYRFGLPSGGLSPDGHSSVFLFTSVDGGATFDQGVQVGTVPFSDAVSGPGGGISLVTNAVTEGELYQRVPTDGSAATTAQANLSTDHPYNGAVAVPTATTALAVFTDASGNAQYRAYLGTGDPNDVGGWTQAQNIGYADYPHLAAGPSGLFMLAARSDGHVEVRKFASGTFGSGSAIPQGTGEEPQDHLAQDDGGFLHVLLPQITAECCPLLYAYSQEGTQWTTIGYPLPEFAAGARGAFEANHRGVAVFHSGVGTSARAFALRIGPKVRLTLPATQNPPATARARDERVIVKIRGKLRLPADITPAEICLGKVLATIKRGRSKLASPKMKVNSECEFRSKTRIGEEKVGQARKLVLILKLRGNPGAKRSKRTYKLTIR